MQTFIVFWFGQLISVVGTGMTSFALAYWAWQTTGSATALALLLFFAIGPAILFGPIAGAIVDRNNRKSVIMLADTGAGLSTAALLFLYTTGTLQIWHVYAAGIIAGLAQAFHMPATWASITLIVTKKQYGRANGMMSLVSSISEIAAPLAAGMLLTRVGIGGIMIIDLLTFAFAIVMTAVIHIPQPVATPATKAEQPSFWNEATFGFRYLIQRPSLFGLQLVFLLFNFASVFSGPYNHR